METGAQDRDYEHDMNAESKLAISGTTTPSGASRLFEVLDSNAYVDLKYNWGERSVEGHELGVPEARQYVDHATKKSLYAQPGEKWGENNYFEKASEHAQKDFVSTPLPNPNELRVDGEIEAGVGYNNGWFSMEIEFDTLYVHENADEEISEGSLRVTYTEPFAKSAENEVERTKAALDQLDRLGHLLE